MEAKESSQEMNPLMVTPKDVAQQSTRSAKDYLALAVATCGVGYLPLAPGTWGSLLAVGIFWYAHAFLLGRSINQAVMEPGAFFVCVLIAILVVTCAGIWAAS